MSTTAWYTHQGQRQSIDRLGEVGARTEAATARPKSWKGTQQQSIAVVSTPALSPTAAASCAHPKDGDAPDNGGVVGRGQGLVGRAEEALGRAARAGAVDVHSLGRHFEVDLVAATGVALLDQGMAVDGEVKLVDDATVRWLKISGAAACDKCVNS